MGASLEIRGEKRKGVSPGKEGGYIGKLNSWISLGNKKKTSGHPCQQQTSFSFLLTLTINSPLIVGPPLIHHWQTGEVGYQSSSASSLTVGALIQCDKPVHKQCGGTTASSTMQSQDLPLTSWRCLHGTQTSQAPHPFSSADLGLEMTDMALDGQKKMWCLDVSNWLGISQNGYMAG